MRNVGERKKMIRGRKGKQEPNVKHTDEERNGDVIQLPDRTSSLKYPMPYWLSIFHVFVQIPNTKQVH